MVWGQGCWWLAEATASPVRGRIAAGVLAFRCFAPTSRHLAWNLAVAAEFACLMALRRPVRRG
jgi:hypothetical protein